MNDYYVYFHRRRDTNEVFYVGKGRGDRAESIVGRTHRWFTVACDAGRTIEYVKSGLTEADSLRLECDAIAALRKAGVKLVNVSPGGGKYCCPRKHGKQRKVQIVRQGNRTVFVWVNPKLGRYPINRTIHSMVTTFGCSREELNDLVNGKISTSSDGWSISTKRALK